MSEDGVCRLDGRVVLVAGAGGGGIGTVICRTVAAAGGSVVALDVREEALTHVDEAVAGTPGPHRSLVVDVRDGEQVAEAVRVAAGLGRLHGAVHVAGGIWPPQWASLLDLDPTTFDDVLALNLRAALTTCTATARGLVDAGRGGSIVTIASIAGLTAMPYASPYAVAKAGLVALTRTAALEWGPHGVRVNAVAPGSVRTPKSMADRPTENAGDSDAELDVLPLRRRGTAEDIAGAVLFLLSDLSSWITGQVLPVDGGSSVLPSFLDRDGIPVFVRSAELRSRLLG